MLVMPIPTPSPKELIDTGRFLYKKYINYGISNFIKASDRARQNPDLYTFLGKLYSKHPILRDGNDIFPVAIYEAPESQWREPETILVKKPSIDLTKNVDFELLDGGGNYVRILKDHLKLPIENLLTYRLTKMYRQENQQIRIECALGSYEDALKTCDSLAWELLTRVGNFSRFSGKPQKLAGKLKFRSKVHALVDDPVTNGYGRSAAIGISTLSVFNAGDGTYRALIKERNRKGVAVYSDFYHVVPSFMFQPSFGDITAEYSILHNVYREYLEEIFDEEEAHHVPNAVAYDYFYSNPNLKYLRELISKGDAEILLTGFAVDLLNLRPEVLTLLIIYSPDWFKSYQSRRMYRGERLKPIRVNWEFKTPIEVQQERRIPVTPVDVYRLHESWNQKELGLSITPYTIVPPGAAAIKLGIKVALQFIQAHGKRGKLRVTDI